LKWADLNSKIDDILSGLSTKASFCSSSYVHLNSRTDDEFNCLKCFTLEEIKKATKNFGRDSQVSEGCVLKGWIDELAHISPH